MKYSWRADLPDFRDTSFKQSGLISVNPLPSTVDLRPLCSPVFNQGDLSSCTGNALAGGLEFLELKELREKILAAEIFNPNKFVNISRMFIYWNERVIEGDTNQDSGAEIRDGVKSLATIGACLESEWPHLEENVLEAPPQKAFEDAQNHKISKYYRIEDLNDMKACLYLGYPFIFGFTAYDQFESDQMAKDGMLQMPNPYDQMQGGHAVLCVGYDDSKQCMIVRNSWGSDWALDGYFYMPYSYISNPNLSDDFWMILK